MKGKILGDQFKEKFAFEIYLKEGVRDKLVSYVEDFFSKDMRDTYLKEYDPNKLCLHWYNIFKNLSDVES